jgi:hypothetical protein
MGPARTTCDFQTGWYVWQRWWLVGGALGRRLSWPYHPQNQRSGFAHRGHQVADTKTRVIIPSPCLLRDRPIGSEIVGGRDYASSRADALRALLSTPATDGQRASREPWARVSILAAAVRVSTEAGIARLRAKPEAVRSAEVHIMVLHPKRPASCRVWHSHSIATALDPSHVRCYNSRQ